MSNYLRTPCENLAISSLPSSNIPKKYANWVLLVSILASSMAFIDGTIVNVALAAIQSAMRAPLSQVQWVVEAYALTLAALLIVGGASGDIYGRRRIFLIGILIFTVASIGCGLALSISQLIMARALQGIGAALLVPGSLALISATFPEEQRGQAIGIWAGFTSITATAGPIIGGWLIQHTSWRWVFFLNLPLAIAVFSITLHCVTESKNEQGSQKLDIVGAVLLTIGLLAIVFGLIECEYHHVFNIIMMEIFGICALIGFFWLEGCSSSPMLDFKMFRSRNFVMANIITFLLYFALYGALFFLPLDLIQIQAYTATQAGAALLPLILLIFFLSRWSGGLIKRFGPRLPLVIGPAIAAMGFALFIPANTHESYWSSFFPAAVVLGIGMAISVAPLTTTVMNSVSQNDIGTASGVNNAVSRIGGLLAVAIFGLVMTTMFNQQLIAKLTASSLSTNTQQEIIQQKAHLANIKTNNTTARQFINEAFIAGYQMIMWISVILSLLSSLSAMFLISIKNDIATT